MNINELALRMRAAAKNAADNFHPNMLVQTRDIITLVEALEKAKTKSDVYDMLRDDYGLREKGVGLVEFVDWQANRIAELGGSTVKLPLPSCTYADTAIRHTQSARLSLFWSHWASQSLRGMYDQNNHNQK
ncbi:hypothetical protein ACNHIU_26460 (plasmid) [Klebsiella pneumoniae]|uniref:hypothetical protein n=2 Tax=Klebsiella pneumoniae TaxID=573 RepID=UPI000E2E1AC3|nr:hypothetical protein [Klebsiella pneumoniae]SYJ99401.1 Uncharacterised protein [Klebsiella pneumoniae]